VKLGDFGLALVRTLLYALGVVANIRVNTARDSGSARSSSSSFP